jgi:hypothetical protein
MINKIIYFFKSIFGIRYEKIKRVVSDDDYNDLRKIKEDETNRILEKISKSGIGSLTKKEKKFLGI